MTETTQSTENPIQSAASVIATMKRATRRKFTAEDKIRILLEGMRGEISITDLCRREGIHITTYYSWLKDFMEAGKARLRGDTLRQANTEDVKHLRLENQRYKLLCAEQMLEIHLLKKSLLSSGEGGTLK